MLPAGDSRMEWTLRLVGTGIDGQSRSCEVMAITRPDGLGDIANLVNRRMNKSQQMRWSRRGADLLLQVRCAVYNGTLGAGFGHRFDRISNANEALAKAA
jgi:hypothetical protein